MKNGLLWAGLTIGAIWALSQTTNNNTSLGSINGPRQQFRVNRKRKFIGLELKGKLIIRDDLLEFSRQERSMILRKIRDFSLAEVLKEPTYKKYNQIKFDFGRLRVGDFRIFVHRMDEFEWLILRIFRKKTKKTPPSETQLATKRFFDYIEQE